MNNRKSKNKNHNKKNNKKKYKGTNSLQCVRIK